MVLIGNSITHFWGGEPKTEGNADTEESWNSAFGSYRVLNLGFGWDHTQNVLWRLDHGQLKGLSPKTENARSNSPDEIAEGCRAICDRVNDMVPESKIILMAVFPREEYPDHPRRRQIAEINARYADYLSLMAPCPLKSHQTFAI
ncbi:hypothetical protein [Paenibacillus wynnii]|uniref:hypothetical protein n=1 Tax=Paenibacillus wynnii TaxID=268407 RepID=UPI0027934FA0|nr:hypothetical protein [Paenibacillus wynnii]MDQ0195415.1 hypothetical protein [Paenibacillus wynnii]